MEENLMYTNKFLTVSELCSELRISKTTAYKLLQNNSIKSLKLGKKILIDQEDLNDYIKSHAES